MSTVYHNILSTSTPPANGRELPQLQGQTAHPPPKRGALHTQPPIFAPVTEQSGLFLDYLRGTIPPLTFEQVNDWETGEVITFAEPNQVAIESIFGPMTPIGYSVAKGYDQSALLACGGTVHWHTTQPDQRVMINLGGDALAALGMHPMTLFEKLDKLNFQVTRMDWAKDDTQGLLDLRVIKDKLLKGEIVTRFAKWGSNESGVIGADEVGGETIYIGNRQSESFVRCYDKTAERAAESGEEPPPDDHIIRVELEIKKRKAQELWSKILETHRGGRDVAALILGVIYGLVDFKEPNLSDSNKWRWETCAWWLKFLGVGEKVRITVPKPDITLARAKDWLNLISPSIAIVNEIDPAFIDQALVSGRSKWTKQHQARYQRWQSEHAQQRQQIDKLNEAVKALHLGQ